VSDERRRKESDERKRIVSDDILDFKISNYLGDDDDDETLAVRRNEEEVDDKILAARAANQMLGEGAIGKVYLSTYVLDPKTGKRENVALKKIPKRLANYAKHEALIHTEVSKHPNCHQYISCMYDSFSDPKTNDFYIMMEYIKGDNLYKFVKNPQNKDLIRDENFLDLVFLESLSALVWIHGMGIAHRDIKLENLMYDENTLSVKFIDFGIGCTLQACINQQIPHGTEFMFPPEYFTTSMSSLNTLTAMQAIDIWSLGVVFMELLLSAKYDKLCDEILGEKGMGQKIGKVGSALFALKRLGYTVRPKRLAFLSDQMMAVEPENRPTAVLALELHETIKDVDVADLVLLMER
jgi:serine/threonine protein kinase